MSENVIRAIEEVVDEVLQVIPKPDDGRGRDWWVGIYMEETCDGFWDTSCIDKEHAELVRQKCKDALMNAFIQKIQNATEQ